MEIFDLWDGMNGGYPVRAGVALAAWVVGTIFLLRRKNYPELTIFFLVSAASGVVIGAQGNPLPAGLGQSPAGMEAISMGWRSQVMISVLLAIGCAVAILRQFIAKRRDRQASL